MAIPVTSLTVNTQKEGARSVVRNSSGIPYVIVRSENFSQTFEIWKGNSTNPTSFSIQDSAGAPNWTENGSLSMAIDSSDVIHVAYMRDDTKLSKLLYTTFDTGTDTYTSTVTIIDDIGDDPININRLKTSIAIDSNDIPHIAYTENRSNMGSPFFGIYYNNRIGGGWNIEGIEVEGDTTEVRCHYPDITIDSENIPVIVYHNGTTLDTSFDGAKGSANDATSFTLFELDADADPTNNGNANTAPSVCVDSNGDHWFAYKVNTTGYITLKKHTQTGNSWDTSGDWTSSITNSNVGYAPTIVAEGTDIYVFYENEANDIVYDKYDGSWSGETVLETGTYNTAKTKWAYWVDNDSTGVIRSSLIYYFDGSDAVAVQDGTSWSNVTDADDGSIATSATNDGTGGSASADYIQIEGTNAPASGGTIGGVSARLHDGINWWRYGLLNVPSGGWTWAKIQALETRIWWVGNIVNAGIYVDGDAGGTELVTIINPKSATGGVARLEIVVHIDEPTTEIDYTFTDETGSPDIHFNSLSIDGVSDLSINVDDSVTTTEDVEINNIQLGDINVDDSIATSEDVSINLPVEDLDINVNDAVTISENISILLISNIEINDSVTISEDIVIANLQLGDIVVNDSTSISEDVIMEMVGFVNVNDSVTISEDVSIAIITVVGDLDILLGWHGSPKIIN